MAQRAPSTPAELLGEGQAALRQGDRLRAQTLFRTVIQREPTNEEAWLWLSGAVEPSEAVQCLRQVLQLNPASQAAHEGLLWLQRTYGNVELPPPAASVAPSEPLVPSAPAEVPLLPPTTRARLAERNRPNVALGQVSEYGLQIMLIGGMLGLLRLVLELRPLALIAGRGQAGPLGWGSALFVAVVAAVIHAALAGLVWWLLAERLAQLRQEHWGHRSLSLIQAGQALLPGYGAAIALGLALIGIGWSEQRWLPMQLAIWVILLASLTVSVRRVLQLRTTVRMTTTQARRQLIDLFGAPGLSGLLGWWLAGRLITWLLHHW